MLGVEHPLLLLDAVFSLLVFVGFILYVRQSAVGQTGVITEVLGPSGKIKVNGLTWEAWSEDEAPLVGGEAVRVKRMRGLQQAVVAPARPGSSEETNAPYQPSTAQRVLAGMFAVVEGARAAIKVSQGGGWDAVDLLPFVLVLGLLALGVLKPGRGLNIAVGLSAVAYALMWLASL